MIDQKPMTLKDAHQRLFEAYGVETKDGEVIHCATQGVPYGDVFAAWQVIADRLAR